MKRLLFAAVCSSLILTGCGETKETMSTNDVNAGENGNAEKKRLDREEKIASEFYSKFINGSKEQQEEFLTEHVHSEGKEYFSSMVGESQSTVESKNVQVIESVPTTYDDGSKGKLVLLNVENGAGDLREVILAFQRENKDFQLVYSTTSENEDEYAEIFNNLRAEFKAPIAKKLKQRKEKEASQKANVEISDQVFYSWKDSIGTVWTNYSAEIKNTGDAIADLGSIQINFVDDSGAIVGTSDMVTPVPNTLSPGETAYIGDTAMLNAVDKADVVADVTVNIDFSKTTDAAMLLETENVNFRETNNDYGNPYVVTGTVQNPTEELVDDVRLAAGLYDSEGKLIGVLKETLTVSLNPESTAGFEMTYPEISKEIKGKVTEVKVKAYNWTW
ncbi:hypothetical protein SporoP37_12385 [Sporosarcina sp. P37]|uniref:FxLYD domain-containing protein n=1 Tax=unclassified Sporosarcina TaxID=2647733 RepID=UPI000A17A4CA|nr:MULTISPECIES: FxLYD domain-containing protein [unclassified Sporosarcina]ARK25374.1 hypothetical protein SporoP37_12385 [Sporosarcina sp. P37]PID19072.1 hypothetical protein CSV62_05585 [Sporosarcina sp. P35]